MLFLPDSNILIYAKMASMGEHEDARAWLTTNLNDPGSTLLICETTILSFLRITTNKKVFDPPLSFSEAASFTSDLLGSENVRFHRSLPEHFVEVAKFMQKRELGGNLVMDVHLALIAIGTGATIVIRDGDFKKIPFLKTFNPLASV